MKKINVLTSAFGIALLTASSVHAQVIIPLFSGDAGGGFAPLAVTDDAFAVGGSGGFTIQGVTFGADPGDTLFNGSANGSFGTDNTTTTLCIGNTANDTQLAGLLGNVRYAGTNGFFTPATNPVDATEGGYGQYLITGLAQGTTYQVDLFDANFQEDSNPADADMGRDTTIEVEGLTTQNITAVDGNTAQIAEFDLQANASGDIAINFGSDNGNDLGILSGVAITSASAVPEPSSLALMLAGFLVLAVSFRRGLRAKA